MKLLKHPLKQTKNMFNSLWKALLSLIATSTLILACSTIVDTTTEKAPAQYSTGPISAKYLYTNNVNKVCIEKLGALHGGRYYNGCYVPRENLIVLPTHWWPELKAHEEAHARGWRHAR